MRVMDPVSGDEHRFTAAEFFLCQAADGESTLSAIQERYRDRFGQDIDSRQINAFYRRLRAAGLLVKSEATRGAVPSATDGSSEAEATEDAAAPERARGPFQGERRASQRIVPRRIAGKNGDAPATDSGTETASAPAAPDEAPNETRITSAEVPAPAAEPVRRASQRVMPRRIAGKSGDAPATDSGTETASAPAAPDEAPNETRVTSAEVPAPAAEPVRRASQRVMPRRIAGKSGGELAVALDRAVATAAIPGSFVDVPQADRLASLAPSGSGDPGRATSAAEPGEQAPPTGGGLPPATLPAAVMFDDLDEAIVLGSTTEAAADGDAPLPDHHVSPQADAAGAVPSAPEPAQAGEPEAAAPDLAPTPSLTTLTIAAAPQKAPLDETTTPDAMPAADLPAAVSPTVTPDPSTGSAPEARATAPDAPTMSRPATLPSADIPPVAEPTASASPLPPAETEAAEPAAARPRVTPTLAKRTAKPRTVDKAGPRPTPAPLQRANIRVRPAVGDEPRDSAPVECAPMNRRPPPAPEADTRRPADAPAFDPNAFLGEMEDDDMFGGRSAGSPAGRIARRRRAAGEGAGPGAPGGAVAGPGEAGTGGRAMAGPAAGGLAGVGGLGGGFGGLAGAGLGAGGLGAGGLGGGGFGGGGFGGGGFGGGGMGGGGRGEALLAALAARGRPGAGGNAPPAPPRDRVSLFNPMGLYWVLNILFWPMRYLHWLLWPLVAFTFFVIYQRWSDLTLDIFKTSWTWSTIALMLVSFLIVNLVARTTQGATIRAFGGQVRQFGLIVEFGFLPRFFIDRSDITTMDRRGQLYCYAAPLVSRLWLWSGGMLIWAANHGSGNNLPDYALVISHAAMIEFLVVAFPLLPSDGMNWLLTWFGDPGLKKKAIIAFRAWVTGQPRPFFIKEEEEAGLVLFAVGAILCSFLFVFGLLTYFGIMLGSGLGGTGAAIFLGLCLGCALWMYGVFRNGGKNRGAMTLRDLGLGPQDDDADDEARANDPVKVKERVSIAAWGRVIWAFIIVFLIAVAFLPYDYEASGQFEILPNARNQANAQTDGEIEKILVREGDWVKPGELLGQLSSWDQEHEVAITKARLAEAKAKLLQLQEGAKSEEITVAEKEVESQKATVAFTEAEMKRQADLEKTGTASPAAFERAKSKYDNDVAKLNVAIANLALVRSSATQAEIDARQADVDRLTAELAYNQSQLDRTRIKAASEGRVITPNLHLLVGKWLRSGQPLLETENTKTVDAEIGIPESDIALVAPGDTVRIKAWGYSDREIPGKVISIAPAADKRSYGMVVRTKATIPNEDGALRSQMTGYAKVEGDNMMVWQAFLRFIVRFFQVEVWSWIP